MLRNIRLFYVHNFLTDFLPHWPFLVIYFQQITGSYTAAMSVIALQTFSAAAFDLPTGVFSDRMGRRLTLALGSFSCALSAAAYAFAHGLALLYLGAIFVGLGRCLFSGNNNAALYETLQAAGLEKRYRHYRGTTGSMFQLALCLSALLSVWLATIDLRIIFAVGVIPQLLAAAVSLLFQEPRIHLAAKHKSFSLLRQACVKTWKNPHLLMLVAARSVNYGADETGFDLETTFFSLFWPTWAVGLARAQGHFLSFIGHCFSGRLIERLGEPLIFVIRDVWWYAIAMLGVAVNSGWSPIIMKTGSVLFGPGEVASDHLMQKEFSDDERATMGSISSLATSAVYGIVAVVVGLVADRFGLRAGIIASATLAFLSLPINLWIFRKELGLLKP